MLSLFHLVASINKSLMADKHKERKTNNIFSEILFNLSPSKQISQSLQFFGLSNDTKVVILVQLGGTKEEVNNNYIN